MKPRYRNYIWLNKLSFIFLFSVLMFGSTWASSSKMVVYLIPGQGADSRLYKNLQLDTAFSVKNIQYSIPKKDWNMEDYARELAKQIDSTQSFAIIGVSLGGMLATEMADFLNPEKVIVISSAKNRKEFPFRYRFQKTLPIYKLIPGFIIKTGARILQPIVEPDRAKDKETFKSMLRNKDPKFLKRTTTMILEWERSSSNNTITHIHGDIDRTLPVRNVYFDYMVEDGSHMMVLTKGPLVTEIVNSILLE